MDLMLTVDETHYDNLDYEPPACSRCSGKLQYVKGSMSLCSYPPYDHVKCKDCGYECQPICISKRQLKLKKCRNCPFCFRTTFEYTNFEIESFDENLKKQILTHRAISCINCKCMGPAVWDSLGKMDELAILAWNNRESLDD